MSKQTFLILGGCVSIAFAIAMLMFHSTAEPGAAFAIPAPMQMDRGPFRPGLQTTTTQEYFFPFVTNNHFVLLTYKPYALVSDSARSQLFLADNATNSSVFVLNENGMTTLAQIPLSRTLSFGIGLFNDKVYVSNWGGQFDPSSVSVISATTRAKIKDIPINACGGQAAHLAINPTTGYIYVAMHAGIGTGMVAVISSTTDALVACVPTNTGAFGVAVHPGSNSIFVGNRDGLDLWRIDGATNLAMRVKDFRQTPDLGGGSPYYVGAHPISNTLFVMVGLPNSDVPDKLFVYDIQASGTITNERVVQVGNTNEGGYVLQSSSSCAAGLIFVAATATNEVWILNRDLTTRKRLSGNDGIGAQPIAIAENTLLKRIYVGNKQSQSITLVDICAQ
jgi:hypothetical protein